MQNRRLAAKHFESLPENDRSRDYYNGTVYRSPQGFFGKLFNTFSLHGKLDDLLKFYPYQKTVKTTKEEWDSDCHSYTRSVLILSGLTWFTIYHLARRGTVLPLLREYG